MNPATALRRAFHQDNDALAEHRHGIVRHLCLVAGVMLTGTMVVHVTGGRAVLVALNAAAAALLLLSWLRMRHGGPPPLPFHWLSAVMVGIVLASVHLQGLPGVMWAFPLIFVCYFALQRRLATLLSLLLIAGVGVLAWPTLGPAVVLRVLVSLVFVMTMINIVLSVIGDLHQALLSQAVTDPLTGAFNRRHLQTQLDGLVAVVEPVQPGSPGNALLALDIDHFKRINDRHGHAAGDEVLCRLVEVLSARKRLSDLLFRTGGEEFMLLLPRIELAGALQMAEDLRRRIAASPLRPGEAVTVSVGVSVLRPGEDADSWLKRADTALYEAKRRGRNRVMLAKA